VLELVQPAGAPADRGREVATDDISNDRDELTGLFERCSNRGRWGADDELGTLNYITDEKRRAARGAGPHRPGRVHRA